MAAIKGQHMRLFFANQVLAMATTCDVSIGQVLKEISNKDTVGKWAKNYVSAINWSVSAECVVCDDVDYGVTVADLEDMQGMAVQVDFALASGDHNADKGEILVTGYAILSEVKTTAEKRKRSICNIQLTGTGRLRIPRMLADCNGTVFVTANGSVLLV